MSMVLTRSPLEPIGMNGKRRSARLSAESVEENEPPAKKSKVNNSNANGSGSGSGAGGAQTTTVSTKDKDGDASAMGRKAKRVYEEQRDGFTFSKSKKAKASKAPAVRNSTAERASPAKAPAEQQPRQNNALDEQAAPVPTVKKSRGRLPATPERDAADKPVRRSKRLSNEDAPGQQASPQRPAHAKSHANQDRSPSPFRPRPVTVEKKRRRAEDGVEEEKIMRIQLPFADTPVIRRNKEMRKNSAENGQRRSSSSMRGRRASSLIDEGRGNALPHPEVPPSEFFKHISADLTEPRRMRLLLGWCATRALPPRPEPPKDGSAAEQIEFQALQAAHMIQEQLCQDLITKGSLSDWFSRDESATVPPRIPLRKKPNPRNVANAAKVEELERELERLKAERAEWDVLLHSSAASIPASPSKSINNDAPVSEGSLSPLHPDLLDSPQRSILQQLQAIDPSTTAPQATSSTSTSPTAIQQRLRHISANLEFTVDKFAHGVHSLSATRDTAERLASRALADAAGVLETRERERKAGGKAVDPMDALRGLARVLNSQQR